MDWTKVMGTEEALSRMIWPIRSWLRFCIRHRLPWWVANLGVEVGMLSFFVGVFALMITFVK